MLKTVDLENTNIDELLLVLEGNLQITKGNEQQIQELNSLITAEQKNKTAPMVLETKKQTPKLQPQEDKTKDPYFEDEIEYYLTELNHLSRDNLKETIREVLPVKKNFNYRRILYRLKAEMIKEIKETKEIIEEEQGNLLLDDLKAFQEDLLFLQEKSDLLTAILGEKDEIQQETAIENTLVFIPTSSGNVRIIEELEKMPVEYYDRFLGLFNSIKDGTFKNIRKFYNHTALIGIGEVKDFKTRVIFDRVGKNTYAIITAFIKKIDSDKGHVELLKNKIGHYREYEQQLKSNLQNEEFMQIQKEIERELFNKLTSESNKTNIKKKG